MAQTILYVYKVQGGFVKINNKTLKLRLVKKADCASYWRSKGEAKTWISAIEAKFKKVQLKEATIKII